MKLTVAFLAALAAADAAEARTHRHARRQYGYGDEPVPAVSSKESPKYNPTSAEVFVSSVPSQTYPPTVETPLPTESYGSGFPASSAPVDYGNGYGTEPKPTSDVEVPAGGETASQYVPTGVYPSEPVEASSKPVESGVAYPTGGKPVEGGNAYPTAGTPVEGSSKPVLGGTGYYPPAGAYPTGYTSMSDYVSSVATPVPTEYVTSKIPISEVEECTTETLTYTVGVGSSAHPVVTEVTHTRTSTIYQTITVGKSKPTPAPEVPAGGEGYPVGEQSSSTITVKSTTTSTKYITVKPTPTPGATGPEVPLGGEKPVPQGEGEEECAAPQTVTVTAKETVYVTKGAEKPTATPEVPAGGENEPEEPSNDDNDYPAYPPSEEVKPSATPSVKYPVPSGNGSYPLYPTAGPTGFQTTYKPSYPTAYPSKPSEAETSSLPYFSFVSEVPQETPVASEKTQPTPAPGYGSGYGEEVPADAESTYVPEASSAPAYPAIPQETPKETEAEPTPTAAPSYGSGYGTY